MKSSIGTKLWILAFLALVGFLGGAFYAGSRISPPTKTTELVLDAKQFGL